MSAIKSSTYLASCRPMTRLTRPRPSRARSNLPSVHFYHHRRRPFSFARDTSNVQTSTDPGRSILIALPALCLLGLAYRHINPEFRHPLALDAHDPPDHEGIHARTVKYQPVIRPPTIEAVNEILRWYEHSRCLGHPSDVLRYDSVTIPANEPCEDMHLTVFDSHMDPSVIDESLLWIVWGVLDGHA